MHLFFTMVANAGLRSLNAASRFVFLIVVAKLLSPGEVGILGLMLSTIMLSIQLLGMEFHAFATRELVSASEAQRASMLRDKLVFHGLVAVVVLPVLGGVFWGD